MPLGGGFAWAAGGANLQAEQADIRNLRNRHHVRKAGGPVLGFPVSRVGAPNQADPQALAGNRCRLGAEIWLARPHIIRPDSEQGGKFGRLDVIVGAVGRDLQRQHHVQAWNALHQPKQCGPAVQGDDRAGLDEIRQEAREQDVVSVPAAPGGDPLAGDRLARPAGQVIERWAERLRTAALLEQLPALGDVARQQMTIAPATSPPPRQHRRRVPRAA